MEFTSTEVILKRAKAAASCPALRDTAAKNRALAAMAQALRAEVLTQHERFRRGAAVERSGFDQLHAVRQDDFRDL